LETYEPQISVNDQMFHELYLYCAVHDSTFLLFTNLTMF